MTVIKTILTKKPKIAESAFIAENASIIGDVTVCEGAGVWFGAVIRGDCLPIRIGERSNIQDLCVLHVDDDNALTIGKDVTVGHRAILHGCTIGDRVLVGMGAIIMNGAEIGEDSIIGAGALVTEKTVIPPRSLVLGFPAKVKRQLVEEELHLNLVSARHYLEAAALYRKEGN